MAPPENSAKGPATLGTAWESHWKRQAFTIRLPFVRTSRGRGRQIACSMANATSGLVRHSIRRATAAAIQLPRLYEAGDEGHTARHTKHRSKGANQNATG